MIKSSVAPIPLTGPIPRGERRRQEIIAVAEQLFLESGFTDTTMQMVALRAGASKETLYRHFGNKEDLFAEVVGNRARRMLARLDGGHDRPGSIAEILRDLGVNLLERLIEPDSVSLMRIVVAETQRDPALGRIFYAAGPERALRRLSDFLAAAGDRGEFLGRDPERAASVFLGALLTTRHIAHLVLEEVPALTLAQIKEQVDEVVTMFLKAYGCPKISCASSHD